MSSTFYGLEIARSGLTLSQQQINLSGHNIANADTRGFTRQRVAAQALPPATYGAFIMPDISGLSGRGVRTMYIEQIRSSFLDYQYRDENSTTQMWTTKENQWSSVEALFNTELDKLADGTSVSSVFKGFYNSLYRLSENPADKDIRVNVMENAGKLTETMNQYARRLLDEQQNLNGQVKNVVDQVNDYATQIASLNTMIYGAELTSGRANDLRDQRNLLLDELSSKVDIKYYEDERGRMNVELGGKSLISHDKTNRIGVASDVVNYASPGNSMYGVYWVNSTGSPVSGFHVDGFSDKAGVSNTVFNRALTGGLAGGQYSVIYKGFGSFALMDSKNNQIGADIDANLQDDTVWDGSGQAGNQSLSIEVPDVGTFSFEMSVNNIDASITDPIVRAEMDAKLTAEKMGQLFGNTQIVAGSRVNLNGGELKGYMDIRDGNTQESGGIPSIINKLNALCEKITKDFNEVHRKGFTVPSGGTLSRDGVNFFQDDGTKITALNFSVSADILADVYNIAASDTAIIDGADNDQRGNNKNALSLVGLINKRDASGNPDNFDSMYRSVVIGLGVETSHAKRMATNQGTVLSQIDQQRQSISGVSLDEEMVNVVKYTHSYSAAARVLTAIDEQLDMIINRMGQVGR